MEFGWDLLWLFGAGCLGGFISGLLGVGGGIIFVPILDYFLIRQGVTGNDLVPYTLANSFLAILVSGTAGTLKALPRERALILYLIPVALSAVGFVLLTSWLISLGTWYTPFWFKLFFSAMLLFTLVRTYMHIHNHEGPETMTTSLGILIGSITGLVAGLSGLGGGIIMIPLFMILGNIPIKKASVMSLAVIPVLALPNVIYYIIQSPAVPLPGSTGYLVWSLGIPLIAGVLMTIKAGLAVASRVSPKTLKSIFAAFIILTILKTLSSLVI